MGTRPYYVYIMGNDRPTLYISVTNNLVRRVAEHRQELVRGFTKKYRLTKLLYFEQTTDIRAALDREKRLKKWYRSWKLRLIRESNPEFHDIFPTLLGSPPARG